MALPVVLADVQSKFNPGKIAGLKVWLDAEKGFEALSDGDPVTTWLDQSGNGNDLTQATADKKPTYKISIVNGKPVVRFDGIDDFLKATAFTLIQPEHVFLVIKVIVGSLSDYYFDGNTQDDMAALQRNVGANFTQFAGGFGVTVTLGTTNFRIVNALYNGATSSVSLDGAADNVADAGSNSADGLSLGGSGVESLHSNFDLKTFLIYDSVLSVSDQGRVERYMAQRSGITLL